jgi:hypothetical protein
MTAPVGTLSMNRNPEVDRWLDEATRAPGPTAGRRQAGRDRRSTSGGERPLPDSSVDKVEVGSVVGAVLG